MARKDFVASFFFLSEMGTSNLKPKKKKKKFRPTPTNHAAQDEARQQECRSHETDKKPSGNESKQNDGP